MSPEQLPAGDDARRCIEKLLTDSRPVAVAFSGGADSTAALCWTLSRFPTSRVVALHYHHGVRGADADADAEHARTMAETAGIRLVVGKRPPGLPSDEASLREDRRQFFLRAVTETGAAALIQGHHADDIAETLLMRLGRGSGAGGLSAPRPLSRLADDTPVIRPLLGIRKQDIEVLLKRHGISWRHDKSNDSPDFATRNRIRLTVAPAWESALPGNAVAGAGRTRMLLQEDEDALDALSESLMATLPPTGDAIPAQTLRGAPRAVLRRAWYKLLHRHAPGFSMTAGAFDELLDELCAGRPFRRSLGDSGFLNSTGAELRFESLTDDPVSRAPAVLPVPGAVFWPDGAGIEARIPSTGGRGDNIGAVHIRIPDTPALTCSPRIAGERYRPLGAPGSQKLQDAMVNRKIPAVLRDSLPVIRAGAEILWAPGLLPSENHRCSESENRALRLTWTAPGAA
jgi:tRNA(Ile)-lysidine synthase